MELKFKVDTKHRKQWFTGVSFSHPAKMSLPLQLWIIENYTRPGDTLLDPMAGSGTILVACSLGRNAIAVELEAKFIELMKGNWGRIKQRGPQLGCQMGECQIIQGDARNLGNVLVDHAIFSPPYSNEHPSCLSEKTIREAERIHNRKFTRRSFTGGEDYSPSQQNIANLPYGDIASIITSPPYWDNKSDWDRKSHAALEGEQVTYSDEVGKGARANIGNIHYYDSAEPLSGKYSRAKPDAETYLSAMLQVYQQCHKVLKPQGLLILVTKNFIRNKKEIRLDEDTMRLCEQAGFQFMERHYRKLPAQSFWRVIYRQKYPDAPVLDKEDILVFARKQL